MNQYWPGTVVRLVGAFVLPDGTPADPTTLVCEACDPSGTILSITFLHDDVGLFHADLLVLMPGLWEYRWLGFGTAQASKQGRFLVLPSKFPVDTSGLPVDIPPNAGG